MLPMKVRSTGWKRGVTLARRGFAAVVTAILLAVGAAPAAAIAGCVAASVDADGCCCRDGTSSVPEPARIERRCCCEVDAPSAPPVPAQTGEVTGAVSSPVFVAVAAVPLPRSSFRALERATRPPLPPEVGPPILLLKRSFLI